MAMPTEVKVCLICGPRSPDASRSTVAATMREGAITIVAGTSPVRQAISSRPTAPTSITIRIQAALLIWPPRSRPSPLSHRAHRLGAQQRPQAGRDGTEIRPFRQPRIAILGPTGVDDVHETTV